jgi:hypothetical protein
MENYIYLPIQTWKQIYLYLKFQKYTLSNISSLIGTDFRNALYKGHGMPKDAFQKLEALVYQTTGTEIAWHLRPKIHLELGAKAIA